MRHILRDTGGGRPASQRVMFINRNSLATIERGRSKSAPIFYLLCRDRHLSDDNEKKTTNIRKTLFPPAKIIHLVTCVFLKGTVGRDLWDLDGAVRIDTAKKKRYD